MDNFLIHKDLVFMGIVVLTQLLMQEKVTYFDFSNNFLIDLLENTNTDQSYMKVIFIKTLIILNLFIIQQKYNWWNWISYTSVKFKTTSDERLKTKINDLSPEEGLIICLKLRPVRYNWNLSLIIKKNWG